MNWGRYLAGLGLACMSSIATAQSLDELNLIAAARDCRVDEARALIDKGISVDAGNSAGYTPLMMAAFSGCEAVAKALIDGGADVTIEHPTFGDAAEQARSNRSTGVLALIESATGKAGAASTPQATEAAPALARTPAAPVATGGSTAWPKLGALKPGQDVLYSGTAGKTWQPGVIKSIDPTYGYNIEGVTGSNDAYFVVAKARQPFWTACFVGDWRVSVPMAMGTVTDGRYIYRTVSGGLRLPPLRINADGTYSWRAQQEGGETLIQGRWEPNPDGPGVILKNAEKGADWLVYNNSRTGSELGETVIIASDCCTHYDGTRLN